MYKISAVIVLAFFYGIYFVKSADQKRHGIKTNQIGSRKERKLHAVECFMSAATVLVVVFQLLSIVFDLNFMPGFIRIIGFVIGLSGDFVFLAAVICMKNNWRAGIPEKAETKIVTGGIYRFSRNPAFLGFDLMYFGVFLMYANIFTAVFTVFAVVMLHLQILQEEKYLAEAFGSDYMKYKASVRRYI